MKILVIAPAWVGDMVMSQSLYQDLSDRWPKLQLQVAAPPSTLPLLQFMPQVERAIEMPLAHGELGLGKRRAQGRQLRGEGFDQSIVLPNSWKSALLPFFADIPRRTGFKGEFRYGLLNDVRTLDARRLPLMVQRFVVLGRTTGDENPEQFTAPKLVIKAEQSAAVLHEQGLHGHGLRRQALEGGVIALCPGAEYGDAKRWPAEHFAATARHFLQQGRQVWILGGKADCATAEQIRLEIGAAPGLVDLTGKTTLAQVVALISQVQLVVSNDSGLMHIASALDVPVVGIYGSTSPSFTPPMSTRAQTISLGLSCSPCFHRTCRFGHYNCLRELTPDLVISKTQSALETASAR